MIKMEPKIYSIDILNDNNFDIHKQIVEHGLIVLKNNTSLEISDFEKIISKLGKLVHSRNHVANTDRTIQLVTEDEAFGDGDVEWHNDWSYGRGNYFGTALYNKANGKKSTTDFVDMKDAYDRYEDKESLDLLEGQYFPPEYLESCFTEQEKRILEKIKKTRKFAHTHHITGNKVLYFSPGTLQTDIDVSNLIKHCEQNIYEHHWDDNEILLYDNIRVMHRRHAFQGKRILWRSQFWI